MGTFFIQMSRYAYTGPLSMTKGCDQTWIDSDGIRDTPNTGITFSSSNAAVFTDLRCYLPWVAQQYGMRMPSSFVRPGSCDRSFGDRADLEQRECRGQEALVGRAITSQTWDFCDFTFEGKPTMEGIPTFLPSMLYDKCILYSRGTVSLLSRTFRINQPDKISTYGYLCANSRGVLLNCAANCRGVDPNAMAAAGIAVLAAASIGAIGYLAAGTGLAAGGASVARMTCTIPW